MKQPEMIGRSEELGLLQTLLEKVINGKGSTVFIAGEAGLGKTRLVTELIKEAEKQGVEIIRGWCLAESLEPLIPVREALRDAGLYHLIEGQPPPCVVSAYLIDESGMLITKAERRDTELDSDIFASMLNAVGNFVGDSLSMMGEQGRSELNSIGYGEHDILIKTIGNLSLALVIEGKSSEFLVQDMVKTLEEIGGELDDWGGDMKNTLKYAPKVSWFIDSGKYDGIFLVDDPKLKQENLFDNVLLGFRRLSSQHPIILFLDDLQWADPTSLKLLHYLSRNTRENKVLILGTYRPEDIVDVSPGSVHPLKTAIQDMSREDLFQEIRLKRLDEVSVSELMENIFVNLDMDQRVVKKIYDECEGNPFFLLELIQMLVEEGHMSKKDDIWTLESIIEDIHIPSKIYDVVARRLDRLMEEQRELLECASVVGEEFESNVLGEVTGMNRIALLKNLNNIERRHNLIHSIRKKYRFDHNKIREVLYNGIMEELREEYHRIVAESYEKLFKEDMGEVSATIAQHYFRAQDERAVLYLLDSGERAVKRYANEEGIVFYSNALSMIDGEARSRKIALKGLGEIYCVIGEYDEALDNFKSALEIAEGDVERAALHGKIASVNEKIGNYKESLEHAESGLSLVSTDDIERCMLLNNKGWALMRLGKYDEAIVVFKEGMKGADILDDVKVKGESLHDLGSLHLRKGDFSEAEECLKKAVDMRVESGDIDGAGFSYNNLGILYWNRGKLDDSINCFNKCMDIFEKVGNKFGIATSLNNIGILLWNRGELDRALEHYMKSHEIEVEIGDKLGIATALHNIGAIYRDKGDLDLAMDYLKRANAIVEDIDDKWGIATSVQNIGVIHRIKCEFHDAVSCHERSLEIRKEMGDKKGMVESMCGLAEISTRSGDAKEGKERVINALDLAVEIGGKGEETMCRRILGISHRELGDFQNAKVEFEKCMEMLSGEDERKELSMVYYEYALMWKDMGEIERSKEYLERALSFFQDVGMKLWVERCKKLL